jgi:ABC-2 type transport system permease protein
MMPLRFFPDWFVNLCYLTPFPHMVNTIIEVYLGLLNGQQLAVALIAQIAWIVILVVAARVVLGAGVRRLVVLGG